MESWLAGWIDGQIEVWRDRWMDSVELDGISHILFLVVLAETVYLTAVGS